MANGGAPIFDAASIEDTLRTVGYTKVIATLRARPGSRGGPVAIRSGAAAEGAVRSAADIPGLAACFIVPDAEQAANVATASATPRGIRARADPAAVRVFPLLGLALGYVDVSGLAALEALPAVSRIDQAPEVSLVRPVRSLAATRGKEASWGLRRLEIEALWNAGLTGEGVVVGHLDTGVDGKHPSLRGAIAEFAEFDMAGDIVPDAEAWDSGDHGTHTAGTIVGRPGRKGAFGVAPGARLASGMVIENGNVVARILAGMEWLAERGVRILNMSLGLRTFTEAFQSIVDALRRVEILPVIAVGNEGPMTSRSPGNYVNVLSIGASDPSDQVAWFSGSQTFNRPGDPLVPDLVAPGVSVLSCVPRRKFAEMDGSSMATPHIAGLAALLLQAMPTATTDQLEDAIIGSCVLPSSMANARANRGVPNGPRAYEILTGRSLPVQAR